MKVLAQGALLLSAAACALVPQPNSRLEEARVLVAALDRDERARRLAPLELRSAAEALERANEAWSTLQDPAYVDHLAYLARQRAAIADAAARSRRPAER